MSWGDSRYPSFQILWCAWGPTNTQWKLNPRFGVWFWIFITVATGDTHLARYNWCEKWLQPARTVPGWGWKRDKTVATVLPHEIHGRLPFGPISTSKHGLCKPRCFAPIRYLSSDRIMTWCICRLCRLGCSITSRCQNWLPTNVCWVSVENPRLSVIIYAYSKATETNISPISILKVWGEVSAYTAQSTYTSCYDLIRTQILNWSQKCSSRKLDLRSGSYLGKEHRVSVWSG